ncbi:MAG: hypothetical protein LC659_15675 [Myxococcales bacterium]|nr:hypothetical protein [Myxococcales bacterium]
MTVDVTWDGVPLAKGATAREQDGGWFVELEQPMPVGTSVVVSGDVQATLAVARVHEGAGAGMLLRAAATARSSVVAGGSDDDAKESGAKKEKRKRKR